MSNYGELPLPGLYRLDAGPTDDPLTLGGEPIPPGFFIAAIAGNVAFDRETLFTEIARALQFPAYFGRNWDAVYDCLTDLNWLPAAGYVIVIDGFGPFAATPPEQWQIAQKVFADACAFWQPMRTPMYVLLRE